VITTVTTELLDAPTKSASSELRSGSELCSSALLCVNVFACPTCGSRAWRSNWGAILWAKCDACETIWKHTRRADEAEAIITRQDIGMNESLSCSML